ncbi:hypothetical protein NUW54_g8180 [Trametes sanguinea]|uniref:Uncharacterized protein n=1 Tax=Trametes sanguinea TaxID=158606 RepID=A0ACC1PHY6_9APHY|nr:hypothetical protein NUW54_g8180 [Trametes sanguinea]
MLFLDTIWPIIISIPYPRKQTTEKLDEDAQSEAARTFVLLKSLEYFTTYCLSTQDIHIIAAAFDTEVCKTVFASYFTAVAALEAKQVSDIPRAPSSALLSAATCGDASIYALFGGQGTNEVCFDELQTLYDIYKPYVAQLLTNVTRDILVPLVEASEEESFYTYGLDVISWLSGSTPRPPVAYLASIPISFPLIGLTQLTQYLVVCRVSNITPGDLLSRLPGSTGLPRVSYLRSALLHLLVPFQTCKERVSFRSRRQRTRNPLTAVEKALLKQKRRKTAADLKAALAEGQALVWGYAWQMANKFKTHKADYFYRLIMQQSRRPASTRKAQLQYSCALELPDGADRKRVSDDLIQDIAEKWRNMSEEEKSLATNDKVQEIYEQRANRAFGRHNVATREFNDLRRSLDHIETELRAIHSRTQAEILLIVTRGNQSTWMQPRTLVTSDAVEDFILSSTKYSVLDYSIKMECFILGGGANARSIAMSAKAQILKLKAEAASLIDEKLRAASRRGAVPGMKYSKFHRITEEFGIIVENWPLTRFCAPGDILSRTELEVLLHAWKTDSTRFRCLSDDEWEEWRLRQPNS